MSPYQDPQTAAELSAIALEEEVSNAFPPKVATAIGEVMAGVKTLGKTEDNGHANYKFAGIDAFLEATRPLCAAAGLIIIQDEDGFEIVGEQKPWLKITYVYRLAHSSGETWGGSIRRTIMVQAAMGSQAFGAAQSYSLKQFMRSLFQMSTGDKEDADSHAEAELPMKASEPKPEPKRVETKPPTLSERADRLIATLNNVKSEADLEKAYALGSALCAELDAKDPERFAQVEAVYRARQDHFAVKAAA